MRIFGQLLLVDKQKVPYLYKTTSTELSVYPHRAGSNPTVARHIFQACPVWIYTQSNITEASYSPEYITSTQQISTELMQRQQ
jgi:hypothetical protein